jgi:hypothetical protein
MHSTKSKPSRSCFWLLAFGFWLLAFGFWLLAFGFWKWAFKSAQHSFAMVALNQLFAFTATYFLTGQKVGKNPRSHHPAPTLRSGVPSLRRPPEVAICVA